MVDDRGYNDYRLFAQWTERERVLRHPHEGQRAVRGGRGARAARRTEASSADQIIRLTGAGAQHKCPHLLRRVEAVREDTGDILNNVNPSITPLRPHHRCADAPVSY